MTACTHLKICVYSKNLYYVNCFIKGLQVFLSLFFFSCILSMMILQSETWQNLNDYHTWNSWMYSVIQDANIEQIHNLMIHTVIHVDHFILYTYTCKLYLLKVYYIPKHGEIKISIFINSYLISIFQSVKDLIWLQIPVHTKELEHLVHVYVCTFY